MFVYLMEQFFPCSTFHKRSSGKLILEWSTANLDRGLREQIHIYTYIYIFYSQPRIMHFAHSDGFTQSCLSAHIP